MTGYMNDDTRIIRYTSTRRKGGEHEESQQLFRNVIHTSNWHLFVFHKRETRTFPMSVCIGNENWGLLY
jgi:hypothetical protein